MGLKVSKYSNWIIRKERLVKKSYDSIRYMIEFLI